MLYHSSSTDNHSFVVAVATVGMQNATLGAVLAGLHFADPLVAAPCAVSSCTQSVMGSMIAAYWRATATEDAPEGGPELKAT